MRESTTDWFRLEEENVIDTPALLIYSERVRQNVDHLVGMIDDKLRLRPHMKTNKSEEAARLLIDAGVEKFKCATIAEAETLAMAHAKDILLAYQPTRPKQKRFVELMKAYPNIKFSCLIDNLETARQIAQLGTKSGIVLDTYIDVNLGMDRTGIEPGTPTINLIREANNLDGLTVQGLHVYDGHLRDANIQTRTEKCNNDFQRITQTLKILQQEGYQMKIVAGGSPTFPIHAKRPNVECSPGTFIYWDWGYAQVCPEQPFIYAALVMCRIISIPAENKLCLDLGHKSIAPENPLNKRVHFLNATVLSFIGQSEEHLVVEVEKNHQWKIGDVWYGVPIHICPTVALYDFGHEIISGKPASIWKTIARDRKITY